MKKNIKVWLVAGVAFLLFILSLAQLGLSRERLSAAYDRGMVIVDSMIPPSVSNPSNVATAALESLHVAVLGTLFGVVFSLILAVFAARNLTPHFTVSVAVKSFAAFVRAVPALIWAILFIIAVGLGPTPGILALAVNSIGMLVKVYAEAIEEIDIGIVEAMKSTGASPMQLVFQGVLPTMMSALVSWSIFRFDINIRYAAILGIVGAGGIGWELVRASRMAAYSEVMGITLVIFFMILVVENVTRLLKKRLDLASMETVRS
ncbi:phosphonate ABC transporter, permease protein PhnE [Planococcus sp. ISL-109]|uniref:phosphonate ABC transporter, permease protein PhnE n=1 Tax=Planococcus sp. ISL-109 TaxID=2819166 RepID=UPI001BE85F69|nr:phosphonate ABC transporter, permease protein PhnE [Planococcus sp. ISL-109]MBT2582226.1 phosphonate ABC transporter, permease protein PhnE [Planococcus sp. ISL-109]